MRLAARTTMTPLLLGAALACAPSLASAQRGSDGTPSRVAPREAAQFDFLIGQWELVVKPAAKGLGAMIHGAPKLVGSWKVWRAFDGWGVQDELRITDASGNPAGLSAALRVYDATAQKWNATGVDAYRAAISQSSGEWKDGKMVLNGRGTDQDGKAYLTRSTFADITAKSFTYTNERSYDMGKSWDSPTLTIEAKRVAAVAPR